MPKGGVLTIRTERKIVDAPVPVHGEGVMAGAHIVVSLKDTSMGIAKENMERILNPFSPARMSALAPDWGSSPCMGSSRKPVGLSLWKAQAWIRVWCSQFILRDWAEGYRATR
jgi:hypothetical protein